MFRANVQTDKTKLIVAFRNFAQAPEVESVSEGTLWSILLILRNMLQFRCQKEVV
jgi:hypothetical protein